MATTFFTAAELANMTNSLLDFYMKGPAMAQTLQERPLYDKMRAKQKTFPGGKDLIRGNVKGDYTTEFMGYQYDDSVTYKNPANIKQFSYEYFEIHAGISFSGTEMKRAGIGIDDTLTGERRVSRSENEMQVITDILADKVDDMMEGSARSFNSILWRDGTQSSKLPPGITAIVRDDPTVGTVGGLDAAGLPFWRNRAKVGANRITPSRANQTLIQTLRDEVRQLRRYGGRPATWLAGSVFMTALEAEVTAKGNYTMTGFAPGKDVSMGQISLPGLGTCEYDPTLDDLGREEFCYMLDLRDINLMVMQGEDMKKHNPARPPEKYVYYQAVTWTGTVIAKKLNSHGVYEINPTYS
jgi:hypothetical protein